MLGCLIVVTTLIVVLVVGGWLLRRPVVHPISTEGREPRHASTATPVYFAPGQAGHVVGDLRPSEVVWVRPVGGGWVAVYERRHDRRVAGFVPDAALTPVDVGR